MDNFVDCDLCDSSCYGNINLQIVFADSLIAEGKTPEEEILSVLDVPPGKMGLVIGRKGASILSIKESCEYSLSPSSAHTCTSIEMLDNHRAIFIWHLSIRKIISALHTSCITLQC